MKPTSTYSDRELSDPELSDHELTSMVAEGNVEAFRQLFDKYRNRLFSTVCRFTATEPVAEDLLQEIFIKLWLNKEKLSKVENFNAYLHKAVRNHVLNYLREITHEQTALLKLAVKKNNKNKDAFDRISYNELQSLVYKAVNQLHLSKKRFTISTDRWIET